MKLPERNRWGRLPGYPINPWVAKLRRSFRRFLRARDAEVHKSWTWGKGGGAARHNVSEATRLTSELDTERLADAIAEAMNHVPWPGERGSITFGGLTFAAAAHAIAAEYARSSSENVSEPAKKEGPK